MAGSRKKSQLGFTLLEVMVVLAIMTAIISIVVPRIGNKNNQIKAAVRHFTVLTRETHNHAKLYGATHRIVIDLGTEQSRDQQSYWVESSSQAFLLPEDKESILEPKDDDEESDSPPAFELASRLTKEKKSLPGDLRFLSVEVAGLDRPIESGRAYIHFFSQGLVEEAVVQLSAGENLNWSLAIHPLTGKADIVTRKISLRDLNKQ